MARAAKTYTYAADDALLQTVDTNAQVATPSVSFTYDPAYARVATMADGTGTTTYGYQPAGALGAGQVATVDGPLANDTITYTYDELGRVVSRAIDGVAATTAYDALGRTTTETNVLGTFTYGYIGNSSRLASVTYPNGQTSGYAYFGHTGDDRLQTIHHHYPDASTLSRFDYTYDAAGNILTWQQQADAAAPVIWRYGYDAADQLTAATQQTTDPTPAVLKRYVYTYDPAGNRTSEQVDDVVTGATYNNRNELVSQQAAGGLLFAGTVSEPATVTIGGKPATVNGDNTFAGSAPVVAGTNTVTVTATDPSGNTATNRYQVDNTGSARTFTYDANGNLTNDGTRTFEWDARNRLTRVLKSGVEAVRFTYDGDDRRTQRVVNGVVHSFVYDGIQVKEERLSTGALTQYLDGIDVDDWLGRRDSSDGTTFTSTYYVKDHLHSVTAETNSVATEILTRTYDPWGALQANVDISSTAFTGTQWDAEAELYYYRARYYDPVVGRFLSEDPLIHSEVTVAGLSPYAYVSNQPTNAVDPLGLYRLSTTQTVNPLPPSAEVDALLKCIENKLNVELIVTSTSEKTPKHGPTDGHMHGTSVDVSDRNLAPFDERTVKCASHGCGSYYEQHEPKLTHYHLQLKPRGYYGR